MEPKNITIKLIFHQRQIMVFPEKFYDGSQNITYRKFRETLPHHASYERTANTNPERV